MFNLSALRTFAETEGSVILGEENHPYTYALYKIDQGNVWEIRLEEERSAIIRNRHTTTVDTILRFFICKKEDLFQTLYILLRNCLLVEKLK